MSSIIDPPALFGPNADRRRGEATLGAGMRHAWLVVGIGGAIGSIARHGVTVFLAQRSGHASPYATLVVNLLGCAAIGLLAGLLASGRVSMSPQARLFVFV